MNTICISVNGRAPRHFPLRILWNKVSKARKDHVLKCGCTLPAGCYYHSVGALAGPVFIREKQHLSGCIEKLN